MTYLDTHVVVWLYAHGDKAPLTNAARDAIRASDDLRVSPIVRLELQYLFEVGRIGVEAAPILEELQGVLDLRVCDASFASVAREALEQSWTRDPFDRIIVAQASLAGAELVTKDRSIHERYGQAVW